MNVAVKSNSSIAINYLQKKIMNTVHLKEANELLYIEFGIIDFLETDRELEQLKNIRLQTDNENTEKIEYGDFQTNSILCDRITQLLIKKKVSPQIVIEPTAGKGSFIISVLKHFQDVEKIVCIEIYKPYLWICKLTIVNFYLNNPRKNKPIIHLLHKNIFTVNFIQVAENNTQKEFLIIGNPPWVTNSKLSILNSENIPRKNNFKNHKGLDALTGKSNFDIGEYICRSLLETFQYNKGTFALLVKNTAIKNMLFDQQKNRFAISNIEKYTIDSKKEFNASVEASLFFARMNKEPAFQGSEYSIYDEKLTLKNNFGWVDNKFVSNVEGYEKIKNIDGICPFEWRQGVKHDCTKVMELERQSDYFVNKLGEKVFLENELVYPILKSSDLKSDVIFETRKYTIVPQQKVGQSTSFIQTAFPLTYHYLHEHKNYFESRKSTIYRNKPPFSIFGVGAYSFQPYKIAISGLYKNAHFCLILPKEKKTILVDDTCYMLGFDNLDFAIYTLILLNSELTQQFLQSITFSDSKRMFTKEILKRIDLYKTTMCIDKTTLKNKIRQLNEQYKLHVSINQFDDFIKCIKK